MRTLFLIALLALAAPMFAQEEAVIDVGDEVADFDSHSWINPPVFKSFQELKGDVILIKAWGLN